MTDRRLCRPAPPYDDRMSLTTEAVLRIRDMILSREIGPGDRLTQ